MNGTRARILAFLQEHQRQYGYAPTVRQICDQVGVRSPSTVQYHLDALRRAGEIDGEGRAMRVSAGQPGQIPVVGTVRAGQPILAVEQIVDYLSWDGAPDCFALRVRGDSMEGAAILEGDLVVVQPQPNAENGEIVVALLGEEATVKRLRRTGNEVWLLPENPAYAPIDGREASIIGKVKAVIRRY
jgi:repressor LexA